jgi:hypothetical protein
LREFENIFKFLQSSAHFGASDLRAESHDEKNGLVSTGDVFEETEVEVIEVEYEKTPNQVHLDPNVARTRIDEVIKRERPTRFDGIRRLRESERSVDATSGADESNYLALRRI